MKKISDFISRSPKYKSLQKPLEAANVCGGARECSEGRFEVISFKAGLLTLGVESSAQAADLQMQSAQIIAEINEKLGREAIEKIRFKIQ